MEGQGLFGRYTHPEVTMHTYPFNKYMRYIEAGDWDGVAGLMLSSAEKLAKVGADFAICPDNTVHQAYDIVLENSPIPWLHIAEEVATEASHRGYKRLGILGTQYLMEGQVYPSKLAPRDIESLIPETNERRRINEIIFEELVNGIFTQKSLNYFIGVINQLKNRGCEAVILGCTEIPLLVTEETSPLPTLDSTRLLARAALRRSHV